MALTSNPDLLSSVSALALGDIKSSLPWDDKSLLYDVMLPDRTMIEFKTAPTGRVQKPDFVPEWQWWEWTQKKKTVAEHAIAIADVDFSWLESRAIAHMLDEMELWSTAALTGTTSQLSAEPEALTLEKLEAMMVEYGLMKPKPPKREKWATMWGWPAITLRNGFFDIETCGA
ncbi:hypothetical protein [Mesorhizobium sp. M8A.F.Ca.ET.021.01.1.1]|uniref:hypothetical protein n=1 Tax=Mesorhizobium sp. M8A.F.Ca.ET.021.01.1.1 TaxID=2496757 RepID=UPI000FC9A2E5|nr:hypothetical protein [Mesorhizobium sp. M8A.F.Ca.ET.021.01.1.1]RUW56375.1 hypothetical protein EOA36_04510 [Mesorhizobium sp. M8A.F.Ca.ET.021.01.1.1]